jgi:hypothetical protein
MARGSNSVVPSHHPVTRSAPGQRVRKTVEGIMAQDRHSYIAFFPSDWICTTMAQCQRAPGTPWQRISAAC